jgi:hypothetical protein
MAALLCGAAQAAPSVTVVAGGDFNGKELANETLGAADLDGNLILDIDVAGEFVGAGAGAIIDLTVTLTNATWSIPVPDASMALGTAVAPCRFSVDPDLDGGAGQNTVTYFSTGQVNLCDAGSDGDLLLTLPVLVTDPTQPIGVEIGFNPRVNPGIYGAASVTIDSDDLLTYGDALVFTIAAGADEDNRLNINGDGFLVGATGDLGSLALAYDDSLFYDLDNDLDNFGLDAGDIIKSAALEVAFDDVTGIDSLELGGDACTLAGTTFTCDLDAAAITALAGGSSDIVFDLDGVDGASQQTPSASLSVVADADSNADAEVFDGLTATDLAEITLAGALQVDTINKSNFAWVRVGTGGTESNFRIQFDNSADASAVTEVNVVLAAGNGVDADTVTLLPGSVTTGFQVQGATITFNSRALGAVSGQTGNANITSVVLEYDENVLDQTDVEGLQILRQLLNRAGGNVATPGLASDNN